MPVIGLTPVTTEVRLAAGLPFTRKVTAVDMLMAPVTTGPATRSPRHAQGNPLTSKIGGGAGAGDGITCGRKIGQSGRWGHGVSSCICSD